MELYYDPAIPLLGTYPKKHEILIWENVYIAAFARQLSWLESSHHQGLISSQDTWRNQPMNQLMMQPKCIKRCNKSISLSLSLSSPSLCPSLSPSLCLSKINFKNKVYAPLCSLQHYYNSQDLEAAQVPISRWVDKEAVVHLHNGIVLSCKQEGTLTLCDSMDGPGEL